MDPRPVALASGIRTLRPLILARVRRMRGEADAAVRGLCSALGPLRGLFGRRWMYLAGGGLLVVLLRGRRRRFG